MFELLHHVGNCHGEWALLLGAGGTGGLSLAVTWLRLKMQFFRPAPVQETE